MLFRKFHCITAVAPARLPPVPRIERARPGGVAAIAEYLARSHPCSGFSIPNYLIPLRTKWHDLSRLSENPEHSFGNLSPAANFVCTAQIDFCRITVIGAVVTPSAG